MRKKVVVHYSWPFPTFKGEKITHRVGKPEVIKPILPLAPF